MPPHDTPYTLAVSRGQTADLHLAAKNRDAARTRIGELEAALRHADSLAKNILRLKALLSEDGEYCITRVDRASMWLTDDLCVSGTFEDIDNARTAYEQARAALKDK